MEYHLQLEMWRGNVAGAIQIARQRSQLSDWIVSMAPLASYELWEEVCAEYADQLEEDGHYHKAVTYLLASQKVHAAIDLFRRHRQFKEAVSLAKVRLSSLDPIIEDLYMEWGQQLMKDGQYEQAAKCELALHRVQEAGKVLSRRPDQMTLKTVCNMTLIADDHNPQGLVYSYRLLTQYLVSCNWKDAHSFVGEHERLKVFLPLLCTHELLVEQLQSLFPDLELCQSPLSADNFVLNSLKKKDAKKIGPPEFLLDQSETESVVPWELHLIGKHSFPHHVLRTWYHTLDMGMMLQDLKATHAAISQMLTIHQNAADTGNMLVQVSVELTLCFLTMLTSETTSAVHHLLQSLSSLHQGGHSQLMTGICQLMLPQGPKYFLKLQQEFNASRVLIAMENNDVDHAGLEGHSTIKKYLTDLKEDSHISTSSVRCRELDCVRAYFYLAVLSHLKRNLVPSSIPHDVVNGVSGGHSHELNVESTDNVFCSDSNSFSKLKNGNLILEKVPNISSHSNNSDLQIDSTCSTLQNLSLSVPNQCDIISSYNGSINCVNETDDVKKKAVEATKLHQFDSSSSASPSITRQSSSVDPPVVPILSSMTKAMIDNKSAVSSASSSSIPRSTPSSSASPAVTNLNSLHGSHLSVITSNSSSSSDNCNNNLSVLSSTSSAKTEVAGELNFKNLLKLSRGILWDIQAKREALTETLGYIHRAISQHLLTNRGAEEEENIVNSAKKDKDLKVNVNLSVNDGDSTSSSPPLLIGTPDILKSAQIVTDHADTVGPVSPRLDVGIKGPVRSLSVPVPCLSDLDLEDQMSKSLGYEVEKELLGSITDYVSPTQKSRKILWMDRLSTSDNGPSIPSLHISREEDGIPIDWDELPVDVKYTQPYVTLALLRQEQETLSQELKRVPDMSKTPFPNTRVSIKRLLQACVTSPYISAQEKTKYHKQLNDWAVLFSVTAQQKLDTENFFHNCLC